MLSLSICTGATGESVLLPLDLAENVPPGAGDAAGDGATVGLCKPAGVPGLDGRAGDGAFGRREFNRCNDLIGNFVLFPSESRLTFVE